MQSKIYSIGQDSYVSAKLRLERYLDKTGDAESCRPGDVAAFSTYREFKRVRKEVRSLERGIEWLSERKEEEASDLWIFRVFRALGRLLFHGTLGPSLQDLREGVKECRLVVQMRVEASWEKLFTWENEEIQRRVSLGYERGCLKLDKAFWLEVLPLVHLDRKQHYRGDYLERLTSRFQGPKQADIEDRLLPHNWRLQRNTVRYFKPEERQQLRVYFDEGQVRRNGEVLPKGSYLYVMGADGSVYMHPWGEEGFGHSSFFAGGAVQMAGLVCITERGKVQAGSGRLTALLYESEHYRPSILNGRWMQNVLSAQGVVEGEWDNS